MRTRRAAMFAWLTLLVVLAPGAPRGETGSQLVAAPVARWLEVDHLMIHVGLGAPERAALEAAGFRIAPGVNQHGGQGSASITVEFADSFLELTWRDPNVPVSPGLEPVAARFQKQGEWRTSGWSPLGIGLRRRGAAPDSFPVPTKRVRSEWMEAGDYIDILAPGDTLGPRLWVVSPSMGADGRAASARERERLATPENFAHPNGARRITGVRVFLPARSLTPAARMVAGHSPVEFRAAAEWRIEVTLDGGTRHLTRDLRPRLPIVFRL